MNRNKSKELAMIVLIVLSILATSCTPQQMEAIRFALSDAVIFSYQGVYYGTIYVFGAMWHVQVVPTDSMSMQIHQVTQSTALERVQLLIKLGATRLSWSQVPINLRADIWSRVQQFGSGSPGTPGMTIILLPASTVDMMPVQPAGVIQ